MHYKKIVPGVLSVLAVWVLSMQITNAVYEEELAEAVNNGDLQAVTNYISKGADVNSKDVYGATALMYAAGGGFTEIAKLLLEHGADINAKSYGGYPPGIEMAGEKTALMHAAARGHVETVNLLLEHGADVNAKNEYGKTASKLASERGHKEIAKLLKSYEEGCVIA